MEHLYTFSVDRQERVNIATTTNVPQLRLDTSYWRRRGSARTSPYDAAAAKERLAKFDQRPNFERDRLASKHRFKPSTTKPSSTCASEVHSRGRVTLIGNRERTCSCSLSTSIHFLLFSHCVLSLHHIAQYFTVSSSTRRLAKVASCLDSHPVLCTVVKNLEKIALVP